MHISTSRDISQVDKKNHIGMIFIFFCNDRKIHGSFYVDIMLEKGSMDLPLHSKYTFIALFGYISRLRKIHGSFSFHRSSKKDPWIFRILGNNYEVISRFVLASNSQRMTQITGEFIEFIAE